MAEAAMMDWLKVLAGIPRQFVGEACDGYLRDQPRRRPTPADIRQRAMGRMQAKGLIRPPRLGPPEDDARALPKPERVSGDDAKRIMEAAGFTPKRLAALSKAPAARTMDEAEAMANKPPRPHWTETVDPDGPEMAELRRARMANPLMRKAMGVTDEAAE